MRRKAGGAGTAGRPERDPGGAEVLQIEFEFDDEQDGDAATALHSAGPAGRSRNLRPATMVSLGVVLLGAALWASHRPTPAAAPGRSVTLEAAPPDYGASVVTIDYRGSRLLSLPQRRIEVDLRAVPAAGAQVRVIEYYISENGVDVRADPPPSMTPLPTAGADVRLDLTVTDCAVVPIGESMAFVDVVADGPLGTMDRFTILGAQYSADLARLLRTVCPERTNGQSQGADTIVAGS